jgi:TolB-like protein/Tfp pilus assembly protein PilF
MSLVGELKRRNVIRMAGLYLVGAWLIVQVAGTLLPMFGAPDWVPRSIVLVLAIGFLPALAFAWVFELTPEGIKRDADVPAAESIAPQTARRMDRLIIVVLALALGYFALDKFVLAPRREAAQVATVAAAAPTPAPTAVPAAPQLGRASIAVLPFEDMSPQKDQEYFSDGMAEEILNALAQVKGLKVAGRTSSFQYKGRNEDLRAIGRELGVAHILEGSVRKQGDRVRITAQLIQASDGSHLWSETFNGDLKDVFGLQENIARAITAQLKLVLEDDQRLVPVATKDMEAYGLYLQATQIFDHRMADRMPEAARLLEEATRRDPTYARAWSRLAAVYVILPTYIGADAASTVPQVRETAKKAIALDPTLAEPWAVLGLASSQGEADHIAAREHFEQALKLDPDDITSNFWYGLALLRSGYHGAGVARLEHGLAVDPMVPNLMRWRGVIALRDGDRDTAEQFLKRARATGLSFADRELAELAAARGDRAEAIRLYQAGNLTILRQLPPEAMTVVPAGLFGGPDDRARARRLLLDYAAGRDSVPGMVPLVLAQLGDAGGALELARRKVTGDDSDFMAYLFSPQGAALRALPQYAGFVEDEGLTKLWAKYGAPDLR